MLPPTEALMNLGSPRSPNGAQKVTFAPQRSAEDDDDETSSSNTMPRRHAWGVSSSSDESLKQQQQQQQSPTKQSSFSKNSSERRHNMDRMVGGNDSPTLLFSRSLSLAPADVDNKALLVICDTVYDTDIEFFLMIESLLNMSFTLVIPTNNSESTEKKLSGTIDKLDQGLEGLTNVLYVAMANESMDADRVEKEIIDRAGSFDCVTILDEGLREMRRLKKQGNSFEEGNPPKKCATENLRQLVSSLAIHTGAADMSDSSFWKLY